MASLRSAKLPAASASGSAYRLLALCARSEGFPEFYEALRQVAENFNQWGDLPALAEKHGMAPLLYHHLQRGGVTIPDAVKRVLQGIVLRNRLNMRTYEAALAELLPIFQSEGITVVVLKGIAVATLAYSDPSLRPLTDLDLLTEGADVERATALLQGLGYSLAIQQAERDDPNGQPVRSVALFRAEPNGVTVRIDLQPYLRQKVRSGFWGPIADELAGFDRPYQPFKCGGTTGFTFGREEMLIYLSRHLARHLIKGSSEQIVRLIWLADLVSYTEHFAGELGWASLRCADSRLLGRLAVCYAFTVRPTTLPETIPILRHTVAIPDDIDEYYQGWPHRPLSASREGGLYRYIRHTLLPPRWWLGLYYAAFPLTVSHVQHLRYITQFAVQVLWARLKP